MLGREPPAAKLCSVGAFALRTSVNEAHGHVPSQLSSRHAYDSKGSGSEGGRRWVISSSRDIMAWHTALRGSPGRKPCVSAPPYRPERRCAEMQKRRVLTQNLPRSEAMIDAHVFYNLVDLLLLAHIKTGDGVFMRVPVVNHIERPFSYVFVWLGGYCDDSVLLYVERPKLHMWSVLFAATLQQHSSRDPCHCIADHTALIDKSYLVTFFRSNFPFHYSCDSSTSSTHALRGQGLGRVPIFQRLDHQRWTS